VQESARLADSATAAAEKQEATAGQTTDPTAARTKP
jgi:hypothetical protein